MPKPKMTADLEHMLGTAANHDQLDVNIFLRGEPNELIGSPRRAGASAKFSAVTDELDAADAVDRLTSAADSAQAGLLSFLEGQARHAAFTDDDVSVMSAAPPEKFWITNAVGTLVTPGTLREILKRDDVQFVDVSRHVPIDDLLDAKATAKKKSAREKKGLRKPSDRVGAKPKVRLEGGVSKAHAAGGPAAVAWSVRHINAPLCWQLGLTGKGILVAMVDTGVNYNHPDLRRRMWKGGARYPHHGYDFANNSNNPFDNNGHGTATAGQVAGDGTSGTKTGVAPEATILAIRVGGVERNFWNGLQFALNQKARVISMSMTWKYPSSPNYPGWRRVCESILAAGVLHANSIGNQGNDLIVYPIPFNIAAPGNCPPPWLRPPSQPPGALSSPISVGATDSSDRLAIYSGRGPAAWGTAPYTDYPYTAGSPKQLGLLKPDVCAPGPGTTSCNYLYPSQPGATPYRSFGGTSAATPHVGGCLAILAQACIKAGKPIVPARVQEALERTTKWVQGQTADKENHYGSGRVDVYAAYQYGHNQGWW
jgi:subtilisin family serine protease